MFIQKLALLLTLCYRNTYYILKIFNYFLILYYYNTYLYVNYIILNIISFNFIKITLKIKLKYIKLI
jgi:hypothetical protein